MRGTSPFQPFATTSQERRGDMYATVKQGTVLGTRDVELLVEAASHLDGPVEGNVNSNSMKNNAHLV